ncbi:MAG: polymerase subunit delta [Caulobacter sp.]|nr:polymerase subunit delta [Caulobacter sp.]
MLQIQRLSADDAAVVIGGAREQAQRIGVPMCIAVVDESGTLIAFERMDGGKVHSVQVAIDKAFTAASARKPTHEYNAACVPGNLVFGIHTALGGRLCVVGGGYPIIVDGVTVGGVGLSSGSPQQDMSCAEAGVSSIVRHLGGQAAQPLAGSEQDLG